MIINIYYYLKSIQEIIRKECLKGACQPSLDFKVFSKVNISLPPLDIQDKTVSQIDNIYENEIYNSKKTIDGLEKSIENIIRNTLYLDGNIYKFTELLNIKGGKGNGDRQTNQTDEYSIPYYDSNGITGYVKETLYNNESIITARKMSIGCVHYVNTPYYPSDNTVNLTSKCIQTLSNKYLYYWLLKHNYILIDMSHGVKPGISMGSVHNIKIKIPSIEIQNKIVDELNSKETIINLLKGNIKNAQRQANEILNQLFD